MKRKLEAPRWDLGTIYPSLDSEEFERDIKRLERLSKELEERSEEHAPIKTLMDMSDKGEALSLNLDAYTSALLSTDTSNPAYLKGVSKVESVSALFTCAEETMISELSGRVDEFESEELQNHRLKLEEIKILSSHRMSLPEERLAAEMMRVSSNAWSRLQEAVTSSATSGGKTLNDLRAEAFNKSRTARKEAFEREIELLRTHETALAAAFNGVKGTTLLLEEKRGWKDPIERSIFMSRISKKAFDTLIESLEEALPIFTRYFEAKRKMLGVEELAFYDLFAPVGKFSKIYTFDEAMSAVERAYDNFSKEAGDFIRKARSYNWIDGEMRRGKAGGAYDTYFPLRGESRIFLNFDGTYDTVMTLAHELGHAYHDSIISKLPLSEQSYPMTLAETASIFGENLLFDNLMKEVTGEERLSLLEMYLQSAAQVSVDILSRYYFEREAFKERREGELTADELSRLMVKAEEKAYGHSIGVKHPYMWAVKVHYYSSDFSFYNYPYAFGELFALGLYSMKDKIEDFPALYKRVLSETGRKTAAEVAAGAGVDIEDKSFWREGLKVIEGYVEEFEKCLLSR